jgi:hypothetical protein
MTQKVVTNDDEVTGSKYFVVAIFGTFGRYVTNLRGTFVENVKQVQNQATLPYSTVAHLLAPEVEQLGSGAIIVFTRQAEAAR